MTTRGSSSPAARNMAEDRESSKARFKSKWNRVFKEKEEHEQQAKPHHTNSFKLDDDVTAFLKPSTDRAATSTRPPLGPKIDIAIAQRWPSANDVRQASAGGTLKGDGSDASPNGFTKPTRRPGLVVAFVKTMPEIIGEGGDETEEPPSEVSRRKALMSRSASNRVPSNAQHSRQWSGSVVAQDPRQARIPNGTEDDFRPQPLKRADTSFNEVSAPLQRKQVSPPVLDEAPEDMPRLSRTPTGFGSSDEHFARHDVDERFTVPQIDTRFLPQQTESPNSSLSGTTQSAASGIYSPRTPEAMAARKRELRSGEGMALRRASAMIVDDEDVDDLQKRQSLSRGIRPPQQHYETLSRPDAESLMPEVPEPRSAISSPNSASPAGRSPFADPKYSQPRAHPRAPQLQQQEAMKPQSWDLTPPEVEAPPQQPVRSKREQYQPSYMRAAQPAAPSQPSIGQVQPPPADDENSYSRQDMTPSYMRAAQSQQQAMPVPQQQGQRERSPLRDRLFGENAPPTQSRQFYNRPNASNNSLNYFPPSPHSHHSRSSSRDGESPQQLMSPSSGYQQSLPSPRFQNSSGSPQSGSPRTSVVGKPSMLSPYGEAASQSYFTGTKSAQAAQSQGLRPTGSYMPVDDPHSRPGSSGSNRSFQRPANSFSAPRPPQVRQPIPRIPSRQEDYTDRPSTSDSGGSMSQRQVDTMAAQRSQPQTWMAKTAASGLREEDAQRPPSSSRQPQPQSQRPTVSPQPTSEGNPAADAAYADFASRVAHMKGVFRLTAEKERPKDQCTPHAWLRTALWWYLRGKAGLEVYLQQQRPRSPDGQPRELLTQPHVDLAKTWWILTDPLDPFDDEMSPQSATSSNANQDLALKQSIVVLQSHIKSLTLSMSRSQLMPPPASLIQGQDTSIWLEYPRFTQDAAAVLSGQMNRSYIVEQTQSSLSPLEALPIGDMRDVFCYGRFPVEVSLRTDQADTDRMSLPCTLSMLRGKRDFLTSIVIASQNELVNVKISPRAEGERGLTWHDVSWKASSFGMIIRLPHGFDLTIRMQERDFRSLWNLVEYARKVEHNLRTEPEEKLVHEAHLAELQYADSSNANAFPPDKIRRCTALVFERTSTMQDGSGRRKVHRGYRLLLFTDPDHKSLASASHEICRRSPLFFEFITDAAAHGMAAMVVRIREDRRQCRILLVFPDVGARQNFYDVLNGLAVGPDEAIVGKMNLTSMNIEPAMQTEGFNQQLHPALRMLQWQKLGVTNAISDDPHDQTPTVASESLRIMARHTTGCITDRLNLSKGELLIRLPCTQSAAIQLLRNPQEDIGMSIDTRHSHAGVTDGITELHQLVRQQPTIRTMTFNSMEDLHSFQNCITGCSVRYDGLAANLSIARRMMVVPIYKKWEALNVRLQIVTHSSVVQLLAFMEDFSHADALCFQVKSTDTFETIKGDGKSKKWGVKLVDAKFSLPHRSSHAEEERKHHKEKDKKKESKGEDEVKREVEMSAEEREQKVRGRFVNLEGLDYAEEHDDITVGFETMEGEFANLRGPARMYGVSADDLWQSAIDSLRHFLLLRLPGVV